MNETTADEIDVTSRERGQPSLCFSLRNEYQVVTFAVDGGKPSERDQTKRVAACS